ncbi:hypothetical protein A2Z10_01600 [Candidatus Azambacteria bacterium RBG_16_47_10]|uniref:RNA polymerase sigma factor n=1 Tax=Candidatus Azambacteria bacterium RBG_16_47_10 TaxID=1797292 RepID=A0A1F5AZW9_9BACT|nr:MAG: hypothetical protein A2Z10_01600 [Candidatus Azambacteria bacterium RBG_16_47_10]
MALYDEYSDAMYRFMLFKVSDRDLAWDLTQDCFMKTWHYFATKEHEVENKKAFLYTIARNLVIDHWRQKEKRATIDIDLVAHTIEDGNDLYATTVLQDEIRSLMGLLNKLPEHDKEILVMRYAEELSFDEIAKTTGKSNVAARVHAHRALKKLKMIAQKHRK